MKRIIYGWALVLLAACGSSSETEKYQSSRSEIIKVKEKILLFLKEKEKF